MSTDNKDEIILEGSEEQSIEAKRNKIDFVAILEEPKEEVHTWHDELVKVRERYDNFDVDKMCARCIREQHEQGIKDVNGNLTTTIQCSGVYSFKNETIAKHGEDIYKTMISMMTEEQLEVAETTVNPLKWAESAITDKKLFSVRSYQEMYASCSAKYKVFRMGRRCIAEYEKVLMSDGSLKEIKDVQVGDEVVSYFHNSIVPSKVVETMVNGVKDVYRITLSDNRTIDCTSNHPIHIANNTYKSIDDGLKAGDKVTTLVEYDKFGKYSNIEEAKLLGYLLSDGYIPDSIKQTPKFTSNTPEYVEEVRSIIEQMFGYKCNVKPRADSKATDVYITDRDEGSKNKVKEWLKEKEILGVKGDKDRKILNYISKYDKESFGYFINRLWSGDGCVSLWDNPQRPNGKRMEVSLTTSNYDLVLALKSIFIKLNINARVSEQKRKSPASDKMCLYWKLIIGDSTSIKNFFKLTGPIYGKEKNSNEALIEIQKRAYTRPKATSKFFSRTVKKIVNIGQYNTYDIGVLDTNNFTVNGIVVSNTGKSFTMTVGMLHRLLSRNNYRVLMVAPMETMITEIVELLVKFCNAMEENPIVRHTQSPIHNITFNTGSTFKGVTAGASGAKAVRGKGADLLAIDECFPAKTKILMGEGHFKTIDTIKRNDRVMSFCSETNRFISKPVVAARCNGKKDVYTYTTVSGRRIHCTDNHPVLTTEGWQPIKIAKNIATTKTRTGNYFFETIIDCKFKSTEMVYNFEVKDTHSYIADDFIVHNCDFLSPKDFNSILGVLIDNKDVELWVSSTPDGESNLYKLSNDSAFKEFHLPSFVIPQYTDEVDKMFRTQLDDVGYNQEVRANFNSTRDGVYPLNFIEQALIKEDTILTKQYILNNRKDCILIMGVDWNHDKVGTRIIIVCYHKLSGRYKIIHKDRISKEGWTQPLAVEKIINLNRDYNCDHIYLDEGFGTPQASQLRLFAQSQFGKVPAMHPDLKLSKVVSVSFGSSMTIQDPVSGEQYTKRTKQFIVENSVDMLTRGLLVLHEVDDIDIIKQMKNYVVKSKSANGSKTYAYKDAQIGDHDLDAYNIALYGFSQEYSVYVNSGPIVGINSLLAQRPAYVEDAVSVVSHSSSMIINTRDSLLKNKFRGNKSSSQFKTRKRW